MFRFVKVDDATARRAGPAVPVLAWMPLVLVLVPSQLSMWLKDRG